MQSHFGSQFHWSKWQKILTKERAIREGKGAYRCADKSLARPTSRCILFDGENISFDSSLVL